MTTRISLGSGLASNSNKIAVNIVINKKAKAIFSNLGFSYTNANIKRPAKATSEMPVNILKKVAGIPNAISNCSKPSMLRGIPVNLGIAKNTMMMTVKAFKIFSLMTFILRLF